MNTIENKLLDDQLNVIKSQLDKLGIFEERHIKVGDERAKTFSLTIYALQQLLSNYDLSEIAECVTDGSDDNSIDACYIEDSETEDLVVNLFQSKYKNPQNLNGTIGSKDVDLFLEKVKQIFIDNEVQSLRMNDHLKNKYKEYMDIAKTRRISEIHLRLFFVTNGEDLNYSEREKMLIFQQDNPIVESFKVLNKIDFFVNKRPRMAKTELTVDDDMIRVNLELPAYVVNIRVGDLVKLYEEYKDSILDKNVRRLLGGKINSNIKQSLLKDPKMFWYKNNGLSIVSKNVESKKAAGRTILSLEDPCIVNGGQTAKTLYNLFKEASDEDKENFYDARVMVRVYQTTDENKIDEIVYGTNNQNKITSFDLKSNNKNLKLLKRYFATKNITLIIKRDIEEEICKKSINSELLLQVYCAIYKEIPHRSKISKSRLTETYYDEVYSSENNVEDLLRAFQLYDFTKEKNKHHDEEHLLHSIYAMLYVMTKRDPNLKSLFDEEKAEIAYDYAIKFLTSLTKEQKNSNTNYSHHNFFKSELSTKLIDQKLEKEKINDK